MLDPEILRNSDLVLWLRLKRDDWVYGIGFCRGWRIVWLVTFMRYDLGYFDDETCRLEPIENPFTPKVLPLSSE